MQVINWRWWVCRRRRSRMPQQYFQVSLWQRSASIFHLIVRGMRIAGLLLLIKSHWAKTTSKKYLSKSGNQH